MKAPRLGEGPCPDFASYTLAFALQLRKNHGKPSVRVSEGHSADGLSIRNGVLLYMQLIRHMMDYACPAWRSPVSLPYQETAGAAVHPGTLVTDKNTMILESPTSPTISDLWEIRLEVS